MTLVRRMLIGLTLLFGLLLVGMLISVRSTRPYIMRFDVPLVPSGQLHFHVGNIRPIPEGVLLRPALPVSSETWWVEAWYRTAGARPGVEVVDFALPMWPLKLLTVSAPVALLMVLGWRPDKKGAAE